MSSEEKMTREEMHRKFAIECFNDTWDLLDQTVRTSEHETQMIHAAHASRYHWGEIGSPLNFARGDWQLSRVYAVLGYVEMAFRYAKSSLKICEENEIGGIDLAFAYESLARASAVAGDVKMMGKYLRLAKEAGMKIEKEEDKTYFSKELKTVRSMLRESE